VRDAGIISTAQRVEHYEIAGYGSAIAFAQLLGHDDIATLLEQTLAEEKAADQKLSAIAEEEVNQHAMAASTM
jgi:ferritin-like metal-binding protein YciE